jgi:hypothetical protein
MSLSAARAFAVPCRSTRTLGIMSKVCGTCGRENAEEAFQCYACRARDFGNNPSRDYLLALRALSGERETRLIEEAIESYRQFPGTRHKRLIAAVAIVLIGGGFTVAKGASAKVLLAVGLIMFGWLMLTIRVDSWRSLLERKRNRKVGSN